MTITTTVEIGDDAQGVRVDAFPDDGYGEHTVRLATHSYGRVQSDTNIDLLPEDAAAIGAGLLKAAKLCGWKADTEKEGDPT